MTDSIKKNECLRELTWRGFFLACILTVLFTAANVYLGLKVGLTFATSIPAAVISMAILRFFKDSNVLENNIVQTIASAAGTISATVFILPALVMVGFWQGFPFLADLYTLRDWWCFRCHVQERGGCSQPLGHGAVE